MCCFDADTLLGILSVEEMLMYTAEVGVREEQVWKEFVMHQCHWTQPFLQIPVMSQCLDSTAPHLSGRIAKTPLSTLIG